MPAQTYAVYVYHRSAGGRIRRMRHLDRTDQTAADAGATIGVDPEDVEAWVEEEGRVDGVCDVYEVAIVADGQPYPGAFQE